MKYKGHDAHLIIGLAELKNGSYMAVSEGDVLRDLKSENLAPLIAMAAALHGKTAKAYLDLLLNLVEDALEDNPDLREKMIWWESENHEGN